MVSKLRDRTNGGVPLISVSTNHDKGTQKPHTHTHTSISCQVRWEKETSGKGSRRTRPTSLRRDQVTDHSKSPKEQMR